MPVIESGLYVLQDARQTGYLCGAHLAGFWSHPFGAKTTFGAMPAFGAMS